MTQHHAARAPLTAVLGPTNTGKTHLAIERMLGRESGMIGLPLRLLAREVYDKIVGVKGPSAVALITGEEKIAPKSARYFVCTVEAMPVARKTAFMAVDEVQLCADHERGHVFTQRLLHARGSEETMLLGAATMRPLIRQLLPEAEHEQRERLSQLTHTGPQKLAKLPRRSAIVAFSAEAVYSIAELLKRQRGGAAVVMGALSPRTRNAQVALYQSGEVDFLVATDAIGMGLNMDIDHVAFAALHKFDGARRRALRADEIAQIAGRAGRHTADGTFGVTGDCRPIADDVAQRVVDHEFQPVDRLMWRNHALDYSSVAALRRALQQSAPDPALRRAREATDEVALTTLADDPDIAPRLGETEAVRRLWNACQIPDFRKATIDQHVRLIGQFARHLLSERGRIPQSWAGAEIDKLDKTSGEVDALAARLAHIRTWTYASNRAEWFDDPAHWRGVTREVEDRLSDALHERLTQRFVDRRTSALVRGLNAEGELEAHVTPAGDVLVEGHHVGRLEGLVFHPDNHGAALEGRALRNAALKALRPEINTRLTAIAEAPEAAIALHDDLRLWVSGAPVAKLIAGSSELAPGVWILGADEAPAPVRDKAKARLSDWLRAHIAAELEPLETLTNAVNSGEITGLARGVAFRLAENLGAVDRRDMADDVRALSPEERRALRQLGVRFGEFVVFLPALVRPKPARLCALLLAAGPRETDPDTPPLLPPAGRTSVPSQPRYSSIQYAAAGYRLCGAQAVRFDILERLAQTIRQARAEQHARPNETTPSQSQAHSAPPPHADPNALTAAPAEQALAASPAPHSVADDTPGGVNASDDQTEPMANTGASSPAAPTMDGTPSEAPAPARRPDRAPTPNDPGPLASFFLTSDMMNLLGCSQGVLEDVLKSLGFRCVRKAAPPSGAPTSGAPTSGASTSDAPTPDAPTSDAPADDVPGDDVKQERSAAITDRPALWQAPRHTRTRGGRDDTPGEGRHSEGQRARSPHRRRRASGDAASVSDTHIPRKRGDKKAASTDTSPQMDAAKSHRVTRKRDHADGPAKHRKGRRDNRSANKGPRTREFGPGTSPSPSASPFAALADLLRPDAQAGPTEDTSPKQESAPAGADAQPDAPHGQRLPAPPDTN